MARVRAAEAEAAAAAEREAALKAQLEALQARSIRLHPPTPPPHHAPPVPRLAAGASPHSQGEAEAAACPCVVSLLVSPTSPHAVALQVTAAAAAEEEADDGASELGTPSESGGRRRGKLLSGAKGAMSGAKKGAGKLLRSGRKGKAGEDQDAGD